MIGDGRRRSREQGQGYLTNNSEHMYNGDKRNRRIRAIKEWLEANADHEVFSWEKGHVRFFFQGSNMSVTAATQENTKI